MDARGQDFGRGGQLLIINGKKSRQYETVGHLGRSVARGFGRGWAIPMVNWIVTEELLNLLAQGLKTVKRKLTAEKNSFVPPGEERSWGENSNRPGKLCHGSGKTSSSGLRRRR